MRNVWVLGLVSFLTDLSSEMVYPLLPLFLTGTLGAPPAVLGLIEGMAESAASLLKVVSGWLADRTGQRKGLAAAGYGLSALGKALLPVAGSWPVVLAARVGDRIGKGVRGAPRDALLADSVPPGARGRAFGLHRALDNAGAVVGTLLAYGVVQRGGGVRAAMAWAVLPAALSALLLLAARDPEQRRPGAARLPRITWRGLSPRLRGLVLAALVFALGNSSNTFLLLRAAGLGLQAGQVALAYAAYNTVYVALSYPAGAVSDRLGRFRVLALAYGVHAAVYLGFALARAPWHAWALLTLYGAFIGLSDGVEKALLADLAPPDRKATVLGLHATLVGAALLPASWLAGALWSRWGPAAPFWWGAITGLAGLAGLVVASRLPATNAAGRQAPAG